MCETLTRGEKRTILKEYGVNVKREEGDDGDGKQEKKEGKKEFGEKREGKKKSLLRGYGAHSKDKKVLFFENFKFDLFAFC